MVESWLILIICSVFVSAMLTLIIIPQVLDVAFRKKLFDNPDFRKVHKGVVPRLGGFSFVPAIFITLGAFVGFTYQASPDLFLTIRASGESFRILVLFSSMMLLYLIGLKDDLVDVKYRAKFFVQGVCALLTICSGVMILNLHGMLWINEITENVAFFVTLFMIIYIINSINLIDGIDGLASGISFITLILYGWMFFSMGEYLYSMISWIAVGTLLVFMIFNIFGAQLRHMKIFMGDTGALTIGMLIAFLSIEMLNSDRQFSRISDQSVVLAFSPLVIPLFDVVRVFIKRIMSRRSPFLPDKCHIHHKLLGIGVNGKMTLLILLCLQVIIIALDYWFSFLMNINIIIGIDIAIYVIFNFIVNTLLKGKETKCQ